MFETNNFYLNMYFSVYHV